MRILFLSKDYSFNGGGERMLTNLANALSHDYDVSILTLDKSDKKSIYVLSEKIHVSKANVECCKINFLTKFKYIQYLMNNKNMLESFDFIIGVGIICNLVLAAIAKKVNVKTIAWEHFCYDRTPFYQKVLRFFLFKNLDSVIVLTNQDLRKYKKLNANTNVIYNFTQMQYSEKSYAIEKKQKLFLFVGRLSKQKGIKYLKKIIQAFSKQNPDWKFKVIGKGELQSEFLKFLQKNNLKNCVNYEEVNSNIQGELEKASCVLMTSIAEGLPMVLIEAQSCGVPSISFDTVTGPSEIITEGKTGFLIHRYNVSAFVEKMHLFAADSELMSEMRRQCFSDCIRFSESMIIKEWNMLFDELLRKK